MGNPVLGTAKKDKILSALSLAFRNADYIADMVAPVVPVKELSGYYASYGNAFFRHASSGAYRAPGTRAMNVGYTVSQSAYLCKERSLEHDIPWEEYDNTDAPYDPKRDATEIVTDMFLNTREKALADAMADTAVVTQNVTLAGVDQWSDFANSDPLDDVRTARSTVHDAIGREANVLVLGRAVWTQLLQHPDIVDRIKFVGTTDVNAVRKAIADLFEVEEVLVGRGIYISSAEGQATETKGSIWGKHAWLLYRPKRASLMTPAFAYTFVNSPRYIDTYTETSHKKDVVRVQESFDQRVTSTAAAYLIKNAVA